MAAGMAESRKIILNRRMVASEQMAIQISLLVNIRRHRVMNNAIAINHSSTPSTINGTSVGEMIINDGTVYFTINQVGPAGNWSKDGDSGK